MGNIQINQQVFKYNNQPWQYMTQPSSQQVMVDLQTGMTAQVQAILDLNQKYIDSLEFRVKNSAYLINILALIKGDQSCNLSGSTVYCVKNNNEQGLAVLIQNIHYRLPDLGTIKYTQAIYILNQTLCGIRIISQKYKQIHIQFQQEMIGFNQQGECKIWLNTNYFKDIQSNAEKKQAKKEKTNNYAEIITAIIAAIEARMSCQLTNEQQEQYQKLKKEYLKKNQYESQNEYIEDCLGLVKALANVNQIDLKTFKMGIAQIEEFDKKQPTKYMQNSSSKNNILNLNKFNEKGKISLKRRISQEKRSPLIYDQPHKYQTQLKKRTSQTTLNSSLIIGNMQPKPKQIQVATNNMGKIFITYGDPISQNPELNTYKKETPKLSRINFLNRDNICTTSIKSMGSPMKNLIGTNIRRRAVN